METLKAELKTKEELALYNKARKFVFKRNITQKQLVIQSVELFMSKEYNNR